MKSAACCAVAALLLPTTALSTQAGNAPATGGVNLHAQTTPGDYPLPRASLPDGFGAKVAFQTVTRTDPKTNNKVVSERLVRCGIEQDAEGNELFPCNPSFDTRPYIKGLDHVGTAC